MEQRFDHPAPSRLASPSAQRMWGPALSLILALAVVLLLPSGATLQEETTLLPRPVETPTAETPTGEAPTVETPAAAEEEPAILPAPTPSIDWSSLGPLAPLRWDRGTSQTSQPLAADPSRPQHLAYCVPGAIRRSLDGGATWSSVPTGAAVAAAANTLWPLVVDEGGSPRCDVAITDPSSTGTLYAQFQGYAGSAPPIHHLAYQTTDGGQRWAPVPPPSDFTNGRFAGFQVFGSAVQALFLGPGPDPSGPMRFVTTQTTNGGSSWQESYLACPSTGPCVRWGPAPVTTTDVDPLHPLWVFYSEDDGKNWRTPEQSPWVDIHSPGPHELAALSETAIALVAGGEQPPLRLSQDGGRSWIAVALPTLPTATPTMPDAPVPPAAAAPAEPAVSPQAQDPPGTAGAAAGAIAAETDPTWPDLLLLPDGALLAFGGSAPAWHLLLPGESAWCAVPGEAPLAAPASLQVIGERLWWLEPVQGTANAGTPPEPLSRPLDSLRCGQPEA